MEAHREDRNSLFLVESGTGHIAIDFKKTPITAPSVIYMHPKQLHRVIKIENVPVGYWAINKENVNPEYLKLLEEFTPVEIVKT